MKDIVITNETVKGWEKEIEKLEKRIKQDRNKLGVLRGRMAAVRIFDERYFEYEDLEEDEDTETPFQDLSPADAIIATLSKAEGGTMSAGELREAITKAGYPQERWSKNFAYFYTVLKRLVDSGTLGKKADIFSYP